MSGRFETVISAIDAANSDDPALKHDGNEEMPAALLYGRRMSAELELVDPGASELLKVAARGQHIERWKMPRNSYPEGRTGYLAWRKAQAVFHAQRVGQIMRDAGYDEADCDRAGTLLRKEGIKRDCEVQMLEDVICLVFLKWYFADFSREHSSEKVFRIVQKTARKMSDEVRTRVLREFDLPADLLPALQA
ncbi:DUF4202 domain-containing protein [Hoeflea prorocentri]|uniref:DUF4202 domain-containing protein n=1 Tax=Hoeflea prorocentri TaxID=1922333 RepID=A0A9X3UF14_9HYPH|nr:DUF4202 domain-containing protein [Hoeflea prorocentri]MCY6380178.1 DUF4202 domain-containing protein [Hoeflea prorocentri]MDA5397978.1 DUF4202 domain-containing protein [Hoeflea prorocentri]